MPRTQQPGLRKHNRTGQYYRLYNGKEKYFGTDESEAYRRFHHFEAERKNAAWYDYESDPDFGKPEAYRRYFKDGQETTTEAETTTTTTIAADPDEMTLRQLLNKWQGIQRGDISDTEYDDITRAFRRFITCVTNKRPMDLIKEDFAKWRRHVKREAETRSGKWHNDNHKRVKRVFRIIKRDTSIILPSELMEWASDYEAMPYRVKKSNSDKLPADAFDKLTAAADRWAATQIPTRATTQSERALIRCAREKRNEGVRFAAMLRVAANCSLDNVDCRRLHVDHLRLDARTPYIDFPRIKQVKQVGLPVDRKIPLLPSVVKYLKRHLQNEPSPDFVFRTADGEQYSESGFENATIRLFTAAGIKGFTWKHLRNVAPSLRKANLLSEELSDAILGHVVDGTSKFYEEGVNETFLITLVNLVGREYFGGEKIKV